MILKLTHGSQTVENAWGLVSGVTWKGDKRQAARTLSFRLAANEADPYLPAVTCEEGTIVSLWDDNGAGVYQGVVTATQMADNTPYVTVTSHDRGMYLAGNDGTLQVRQEPAEGAVARLCREYGIETGELAYTGVPLDRKFAGVPLWGIVTTLYTLASRRTGKQYLARFDWDRLTVLERSESERSLVIRPYSNLLQSSTTRSIQDMVNSVGVYDRDGARLTTVRDEAAVALYGLLERHITQREGEDPQQEAQAMLAAGGLSQSVTVECMGDCKLITGATVVVRQPLTGLSGLMWIDSDTHVWQDGVHTVTLTLNLRNLMYESEQGGEL